MLNQLKFCLENSFCLTVHIFTRYSTHFLFTILFQERLSLITPAKNVNYFSSTPNIKIEKHKCHGKRFMAISLIMVGRKPLQTSSTVEHKFDFHILQHKEHFWLHKIYRKIFISISFFTSFYSQFHNTKGID